MSGIRNQVAVVGIGYTRFGGRWDASLVHKQLQVIYDIDDSC